MPVINIEVLQDVWGGSEVADARITATVNRANIDAYRVNNQFVIFPRDLVIPVVDGAPTRPFILTQLPISYYWHIDIFVNGEAPVRRTVIVPEGDGPFDFEDLIDVDPGTAQPDPGANAYQAWLDQMTAAALHNVPAGGTTGQVLAKASNTNFDTEWVNQTGGSAEIADFTFTNQSDYDPELNNGGESEISLHNKDFTIRTTRDVAEFNIDADINLRAADDVFINAEGDEVSITAANEVSIHSNDAQNTQSWYFNADGHIVFPDGTVQPTAYVPGGQYVPLPDFLTYAEGREALPILNTNFGWDSFGAWFGPTALDGQSNPSYPIFSDFTLSETDKVVVSFDVDITDNCSDAGVCVYVDGTVPNWAWSPDASRIAAQFNCPNPQILGLTVFAENDDTDNIPAPGVYRVVFTYDPTAETEKVVFQYFNPQTSQELSRITANEALPTGSYRIGFASDTDSNDEEGGTTPPYRTYISNLEISVNNGAMVYTNTLQEGYSGDQVLNTGDITFSGVRIIGAGTASGDGFNNGTMELVPDSGLYQNDQYLVIDPTAPNHIHVRAGGPQDNSDAVLIIGAEETNVTVVDSTKSVAINTAGQDNIVTLTNENTENSSTLLTSVTGLTLPVAGSTTNVEGTIYTVTSTNTDTPGFTGIVIDGFTFAAGGSYTFTTANTVFNQWTFTDAGRIHFPSGSSNSRTGTGEVLAFNNTSQQSIITGSKPTVDTPTAQRIVVAGQDGVAGTSFDGEGGDVYLWAGRGGGTTGDGGDIKIDGGNAAVEGGSGGYVKIRGGYAESGAGGAIQIEAGDSYNGAGGDISLSAGTNSIDTNQPGGSVNITAGGSGDITGGGSINLTTYSTGKITLSGDGGEFLNDSAVAENQIATIGDLAAISLTPGPQGEPGATGATGPGVAVGGTAGQILSKVDGTDYNTTWIDNYTEQVKHTVKAGVALTKGQAVYVSSATGTNMVVSKASNAGESTSSKTMGLIAQDLALNASGYVIAEGLLSGLNTGTAANGDPVWLGTNGDLIYGLANKPSAPAHLVFIGVVTRAQTNNGEIFVKVQNGFELHELHDLQLEAYASIADNEVIAFDTASGSWKNQTPTEAGLIATNTNAVVKTVNEAFTTINGATGVVAHDYSTGAIFNHTAPAANFTANITNLVLASGYGTSITLVINQGATARIPSALQIGGVAQTINWQGGSAPTGSANKKDVVSFSILNASGTYTVLGQLVSFG